MYARHSSWSADEFKREKGADLEREHGIRADATTTTSNGACVGNSSSLVETDCAAWQELFDATQGNYWDACTALRLDPCSCLAANGEVACVGGFIVTMGLQVNGLNGTLPASLAKMSKLTDLQLEGNYHGTPGSAGLGGVLPALPFQQYTGCGLEGNLWSCPLPEGAAEACSAGQPLTCHIETE